MAKTYFTFFRQEVQLIGEAKDSLFSPIDEKEITQNLISLVEASDITFG